MKFYLTLAAALLSFQLQAADKKLDESKGKTTMTVTPTTSPKAAEVKFRKDGSNYVVILQPGQKIIETLNTFMEKTKIPGGHFVALGGVKNTTIAYYNLKTKVYQDKTIDEPMEVLSLTGSLGTADKKPAIHAHITLSGADYKVIGGHLKDAEVTVTLEVYITATSKPLIRQPTSEFTGVKLINLDAK